MKFRILILTFVLLMISYAAHAHDDEKVIPAWTYYEFGPFITGKGKGFTYEFTELLNKSVKQVGLRFEVVVYPRKRLERILTQRPGVVLFVNPIWMHDKEKTRFLWTPPILWDRNEILSRMKGITPAKIKYEGIESLNGLTMGGVLGRSYKDIDDAVAKGNIVRDDAPRESQTLKKLVIGRVDFMTSAGSLIRYLVKDMGLEKDIFFSPNPLFEYSRHILVNKKLEKESTAIFYFVSKLTETPEWKRLIEKYGLQPYR